MYMLYSSDLIIGTVSCIPTGRYNNVHALFFSPYHMFHVMYTTVYTCIPTVPCIYNTIMYATCLSYLSCIPTGIYNNVCLFF